MNCRFFTYSHLLLRFSRVLNWILFASSKIDLIAQEFQAVTMSPKIAESEKSELDLYKRIRERENFFSRS